MRKVAEISAEQYRKLYGQEVQADWLFHPTAMPDGRYFISEEEINAYSGQTFAFIKDLDIIDFDESIPDTTPPTETGYGVVIPADYVNSGLFPNNEFRLNGFVIPLVSYNGGLAVDLAYLDWSAFRIEQDKKINETVKLTFSTLWYALLTEYQSNNVVQL